MHRYVKHRLKKRELITSFKRVPCMDCGNTFPTCAMDFDHRDPKEKKLVIGPATSSIKRILEEIKKCDIVCANCHRVRTHGCSGRTH